MKPAIQPIATADPPARAALLALNNAHARETSFLTPQEWDSLLAEAFRADCSAGTDALLIALDQNADYDSPNFLWFRKRLEKFVYVDRLVVAKSHRGRGIARHLYLSLFRAAMAAGHRTIVCEVNLVPPNPASDGFHSALGFAEMGRATLDDRGIMVRYLVRELDGNSPPR